MRILFKAFLLIVKNSCFLQVLWLNTQHERWNKLWNFYTRKIDFWFFFQRKGKTFHCSILLPQHLQTTRGFWFEKALSLWQEFSPSLKSGATSRHWKHSPQIKKHFQQTQATAPPSPQCGIGGRDFFPLRCYDYRFRLNSYLKFIYVAMISPPAPPSASRWRGQAARSGYATKEPGHCYPPGWVPRIHGGWAGPMWFRGVRAPPEGISWYSTSQSGTNQIF